MILDATGASCLNSYNHSFEESTNEDTKIFYNMLNVASCPLCLSCTTQTELSIALRMLSIKSDYNMPHGYFDEMMMLLKKTNLKGNLVLPNFYKSKKLVSKLGLRQKKIDCCINGYILYYKGDENERSCKFCGAPRYKRP